MLNTPCGCGILNRYMSPFFTDQVVYFFLIMAASATRLHLTSFIYWCSCRLESLEKFRQWARSKLSTAINDLGSAQHTPLRIHIPFMHECSECFAELRKDMRTPWMAKNPVNSTQVNLLWSNRELTIQFSSFSHNSYDIFPQKFTQPHVSSFSPDHICTCSGNIH